MTILQNILPNWLADSGDSPGGGLLWLVITVVVLVSQIVKANKKPATPSSADNKPEHSPSADPTEELQRFLQGLRGNARPQAAPKPPPVPTNNNRRTPAGVPQGAAARRAYLKAQAKPVITPATPMRSVKRASTTAPPVVSPRADVRDKPERPVFRHLKHRDNYAQKEDAKAAGVLQLRQGIGDDLIGKRHLRKAMVLKEILGQPLAMRLPASGS